MMQWILSSSVLILAVIALRFALRGRIALRVQYALWLLVLVRLLVPVSFGTSALSVANAVPERAPIVMADRVGMPDTEQGNTFTPSVKSEFNETIQPSTPTDYERPASALVVSVPAEETDWAAVLRAVWLFGAAALGLVFLTVNLRFGRRLRRSRIAVEETDAVLAVYETTESETPCLFGLVKPSIYVTGAARAERETLRYAIAHEQTHYRHGDHLWAVLRGVCLALHWYNPLVWWAAELSRRDAELACDEATIKALGESERAAYGRTLLRMTCEKRPALLVTATTMTDNGRGLRERITLLVKKPKTAAYAAVAAAVIALIAVVCTFTGREAELAAPFGKTYPAVEIVYDAPVYSMTYTKDTMPSVLLEQTSVTLRDYTACDYAYSSPEELTLTAENFDALFVDAADGTNGWVDGKTSAAKLRRENAKAWSCAAQEARDGLPNLLYFLQQKDGTLYLALGYDAEATDGAAHFRWLLRLGEPTDTTALETWSSMEAYVLARTKALKAPNAFSYYLLPEGDAGGAPVSVLDAAADVRVVALNKEAICEGISPDGTLELWLFAYEVKPVDAAGALPGRFSDYAGCSITADGYISDGWYEYLTVLHRTDGSYQILREERSNGGFSLDGKGYASGSEYLYDFYIDYAQLNLPKCYNQHGWHRYDSDGWYLYAPSNLWNHTKNGTREEWYSAYLTGSTVRVQKSSDSAAVWEQDYLEPSYTLEQQTENPALSGPWYRTEADGTEYALYLAAAEDGGSYLITTFWKPDYEDFSCLWGEDKKQEFIETEATVLREIAQSFAIGTAPGASTAQPAQQKPKKVVLLADGSEVDMQLYRGEGWSVYAPTDWTYTPQWKQWTAPGGAEAHFSISESTASMENVKAYYASAGAWPFETNMPSPLDYYYNLSGGYDAATGYAHEELYFIPVDEHRSYVLSCFSVNGTTSAQDKLILRAMAQSFALGEVSGGVDANAPTFESDWAMLDGVENFASFLTLSKDGTELGGYSLRNTWNKPQLNSYVFVSTIAPDLSGKMKLTLRLANNDASYFEFYEGTNTVGYFRAGSAEYHAVSDDFAVGDGVGLYDEFRSWYDEAELATLREEAVKPIPDIGQTWEQAAQEWLDAYEGVRLKVTSGSLYKFTWLKTDVEPAEDMTEFYRERGEAEENTYCFYSKAAFVAESERALNSAMAGNTGPCTISGAPEGAYEYTRCCTITRTADGWVGVMGGTGW